MTMTTDGARAWLITASLAATGAAFVFFLAAPAIGYPLTWEQSIRLFEIVLPVFVGYLGAAVHFVFKIPRDTNQPQLPVSPLFGLLVRGPFILFVFACITSLWVFGFSNRAEAPPGQGMNVDTLAWAFSAALSLLAVTTTVVVTSLFANKARNTTRTGERKRKIHGPSSA
jgi:hypothetical protein